MAKSVSNPKSGKAATTAYKGDVASSKSFGVVKPQTSNKK